MTTDGDAGLIPVIQKNLDANTTGLARYPPVVGQFVWGTAVPADLRKAWWNTDIKLHASANPLKATAATAATASTAATVATAATATEPAEPVFDLIIGADIVYLEETYDALIATLTAVTRPPTASPAVEGTHVWLCSRMRYASQQVFYAKMDIHFELLQEIPATDLHPNYQKEILPGTRMRLLHYRRKLATASLKM
jgi:hypothetical protein